MSYMSLISRFLFSTSAMIVDLKSYIDSIYSHKVNINNKKKKYIYIYIYREMSSSYTWCNLIKITSFVDRRFVIDLMIKKIALNAN